MPSNILDSSLSCFPMHAHIGLRLNLRLGGGTSVGVRETGTNSLYLSSLSTARWCSSDGLRINIIYLTQSMAKIRKKLGSLTSNI